MLDSEMTELIKTMVGDSRFDSVIPAYLKIAKSKVINHLFPFDDSADWSDVPDVYHAQTCEIAVYLLSKRGAEGETDHKENGTTRSYESASVPSSMFSGMVPFVGVPR